MSTSLTADQFDALVRALPADLQPVGVGLKHDEVTTTHYGDLVIGPIAAAVAKMLGEQSAPTGDVPLAATVTVLASQNMGDHAIRVATSHEYVPGETVEDLLRRVLPGLQPYNRLDPTDEIVLRLVVDRFGQTPDTPTPDHPPF